MLATITAALVLLYAAATAPAEATVRRIHTASIALHSLDLQMVGRLARTIVPDILYLEYKSLYLELKPSVAVTSAAPPAEGVGSRAGERPSRGSRFAVRGSWGGRAGARPSQVAAATARQDARCPSGAVTKADLRAAVKTILRGEDVNAAKPGPRLTPAKRRQIETAKAWRASHAGCSLHNACIRSFVPTRGGYKNSKTLYRVMSRKGDN